MRLRFLGTGSAYPSERAQTGLLVEDDPLLIDCGSGVMGNLVRSGVGVTDIGHVLLTHTHLDHVADLLSLVQADWLAGSGDLAVYGPPGVADTIATWLQSFDYLDEAVQIHVTEVAPEESFTVEGRRIRTLETDHGPTTLAYRIDDAFVFSGDTAPIPEMVTFSEGCDLLVHECSFPDGGSSDVSTHTTPSKLARVLEPCDVERLLLTHVYPAVEGNQAGMIETISERYSGDVAFAEDLMVVDVG